MTYEADDMASLLEASDDAVSMISPAVPTRATIQRVYLIDQFPRACINAFVTEFISAP